VTELSQLKCVACRGGDPMMTDPEIAEVKPQVSEWELVDVDGIKRLQRVFKLKDFAQALNFANRIGEIAEQENHHPMLIVEWGKVTVQWWTHVVKGLHKNDFIMAAKTDELFNY